MIYGSVCSGIEAASVAWEPLGWRASFVSEIEPFPRAVLAARYPHIPLHGDFTTIEAGQYDAIDLLVGGTPCQSFSVAGLRGGLADDRGNLALEYLRLADRLRPKWLVWENVPGVLSSNGGRDFGAILGGMVELGYGIAYRVLDAQHFGVPQRRRRVFVVGHLGDWRRAAAVLFERHSLQGHPPPRRETGEGVAPTISARHTGGGGLGTDFDCDGGLIAPTLNAAFGSKLGLDNQHIDGGAGLFVTHSLRADGFDASEDGTGRGTPLVPVAQLVRSNQGSGGNRAWLRMDEPHATLEANANANANAFSSKDHGADAGEMAPTLRAGGHSKSHANAGVPPAVAWAPENYPTLSSNEGGTLTHIPPVVTSAVRRLTPEEYESLQGFPRGWTDVPYRNKPAADGPRYKALGNSMAVPVMRWIGERIAAVDHISSLREAT